MARPRALDRKEVIEAIKRRHGKVSAVADDLGVSQTTIWNYARKFATVQQAIDDAREEFNGSLVDMAEFKLFLAAREGERWAVKYILDKKGHDRGYTDKQEMKISGGLSDPIKIYLPEKRSDDDN